MTRTSIATVLAVLLVAALCVFFLPGCGNVQLKGDSMTAAEMSTTDAFNATQRAEKDANIPNWTKAYLDENFKQWRCFVWSAKKDTTWGPKLPEESGFPVVAPLGGLTPAKAGG